jgi:hypothetical protein
MKETNAVFLFFQYLVGESFEDVKKQYGGNIFPKQGGATEGATGEAPEGATGEAPEGATGEAPEEAPEGATGEAPEEELKSSKREKLMFGAKDYVEQKRKKLGKYASKLLNPLKKENMKAALANKNIESGIKMKHITKEEAKNAIKPLTKMKTGFKFDEERARRFRDKNKTPFLDRIVSFMTTLLFLITFPILPFFYIIKATINNFGTTLKGVLYSL